MLRSFTTLEKDEIRSIAIGGFDGMHLAHQALISKLDEKGALLIIERNGVGLTPAKERCLYHDKPCVVLEFEKIKQMQPEAFVQFLQTAFVNLKKIVVGYDFFFGKDRRGDIALLKSTFRGEVEVVEEVHYEGISVHSRKIKALLLEGEIEKANMLLGRDYHIKGTVVPGQGLGKKALYATFNLSTGAFFLPREGVYASKVKVRGALYPSVTFIGTRVSTDQKFSIETHLLDEAFDAKVERVELYFVAYLRENRKFDDLRDLKIQISQDIDEAKAKL